uniref:FAD-binding domain-containing protein n=1 Tax=Fagus sylvatica TaxID=28930 RepID=A0A2N9EYW1_FAGSY
MSLLPSKLNIPLHLHILHPPNPNPGLPYPIPRLPYPRSQTPRFLCAKRTGKQRYPSEKKKLKQKHKETLLHVDNKFEGIWRLSKLGVPLQNDPGKDSLVISQGLLQEIAKVLQFPVASMLPQDAFCVVRKSFDARKMLKEPKFVYTVDMDVSKLLSLEPRTWDFISRLEPKLGLIEHMPNERVSDDLISIIHDSKKDHKDTVTRENGHDIYSGSEKSYKCPTIRKTKIAVVGSGPAGLFASLVLAELGADVTLIERGQAVEQRGRDIGALGGAGTWSDGKLVTRIGRNSGSVLAVMKTLVQFGTPKNILVDGKPHLGTDRLIPLLRNFRQHLQGLGVTIKFGTRVDDLVVEDGHVVGVKVSDSRDKSQFNSQKVGYDGVVLAVGHSARDIYQMLLSHNMVLVPKDFAVGLRIEHPQELINRIQYSALANEVYNGRGKVPVADYKVVKYVNGEDGDPPSDSGATGRNCYSFCMCPGGQVVLTSTNPSELCVNGMSFSRRASKWANAALVVTVSTNDFEALGFHGPLAGVEFQREFERRAAIMGGGNFVVPVQTVTDFLENSYRLGVKAANLHELFPIHITEALQHSISTFDKELPGFISSEALLHGVETRTSSPIQIPRNTDTYESTSLKGLYPVGEGAGYAGGIVSAAVDGMYAGFAVARNFDLYDSCIESILGKAQSAGFVKY